MSKHHKGLIETATEVVEQVADQVGPVLESAVETAREKLADGVELLSEGRDVAVAKLAEVTAEPEPTKKCGGRLKWILATLALAVLGGAILKKRNAAKGAGDNWQSSYTPPAPVPPVAQADDAAAASPDEALADNAAEPHVDTTPDEPAEVVEIAEPDEVNPDPAEGDDRP